MKKLRYVPRSERAARNAAMEPEAGAPGVSADGYITAQSACADLYYGVQGLRAGGCGPIACYNVLKGLGMPEKLGAILKWMEDRGVLNGVSGTWVMSAVAFMRSRGLECRVKLASRRLPAEFLDCDALVVMYHALGRKKRPYSHFVTLLPVKNEDGVRQLDAHGDPVFRYINGGALRDRDGYFGGNGLASYERCFSSRMFPTFAIGIYKN